MTLKNYLILMGACSAAAWACVALIVFGVDPDSTSAGVFTVFYAALFMGMAGLLSLIGFSARVFVLKRTVFISQEVALAFRQAVLLAGLIVGALWLQSRGQLNWWTGSLMVIIMTFMESFFIAGRTRRPPEPVR